MKITLIHNPKAGNQSHLDDQIVRFIRAGGHKVRYQSSKENKWKRALKKPCDIIAVAGGDGTVGSVAKELIGSRTPIAILPLGTANNIANSLGIAGTPLEDLIDGWKTARPVNFDAGMAKGPWGSQYFIEGFGIGLFAATMSQLDKSGGTELPSSDNPKKVIPAVMKILNDQLKNFPPEEMMIQLDGKDVSGDYLLLEALNTRYIGPNLDLVPSAEISDGFLDIVFVAKRERTKLVKYISDRMNGKKSPAKFSIRRGQCLQIEWQNSPIHIDDMTWPKAKDRTPLQYNAIDIRIEPASLVFLTPADRKATRTR